MLLITTTHQPATDLGYLLHKNPNSKYERNTSYGKVTVVLSAPSPGGGGVGGGNSPLAQPAKVSFALEALPIGKRGEA